MTLEDLGNLGDLLGGIEVVALHPDEDVVVVSLGVVPGGVEVEGHPEAVRLGPGVDGLLAVEQSLVDVLGEAVYQQVEYVAFYILPIFDRQISSAYRHDFEELLSIDGD